MPPHASSSSEQLVEIDPQLIYFTFSRIRPRFSCGRTIESTLQQFRNGELQPRDLPLLSVLTDGTQYFSQNNRRLYTYKQLRQEGLLSVVPVRLRPFPQTKRMQNKYTAETCSLTATLMRDVGRSGEAVAGDGAARKVKGENILTEAEGEDRDDADEEEASGHDDAQIEAKNTAKYAEKQKGAATSPPVSSSASALPPKQPPQQSKKLRQKEKKAQRQQQRGHAKGRGSDDDDDADDDGSSNTLEAELRRLGLQ